MRPELLGHAGMITAGLLLALAGQVYAQKAESRPERDREQERRAAQRTPEGGQPDRPGTRPNFLAPQGLMRAFGVLTPEQRASIRDVMQENREKSRALEEKLVKARQELLEQSLQEDFNEKAVRKQARVVAKLEAERTLLMAKALAKVDPPLTDEQRRELRRPPPRDGEGRYRLLERARRDRAPERQRPDSRKQ